MQRGRQILSNFFENVTNTVKAKLAALNPINNFIKYSLETTFDQFFIDQKLSYQSLLSGTLQLPDLKLDITNINHNYLFSSPFTLHSGRIGHLKIKLPSFLQMDNQNIQVEIKDVVLQLKPIQNFEENYKLIMEEIQQFLHLFVKQNLTKGVLFQENSQDYFKQTLRQLFTNMTIKIQNIAALLYIENPELQNKTNPYYLMLKVPLINVHKGDNAQIAQNKVQETKFDCQIPQFTLHIMKTNNKENYCKIEQKFQFSYPGQNHPSTILLFGLQNYKNLDIQTDQTVPRLKLSVSKSYEKAQKNTKLWFQFPKIQLMINPEQIKVIILIIKQINQFKDLLKRVKKQLGINQQDENQQITLPTTMRKKSSLDKKNQDMFKSISMSLVGSNVVDFSKIIPKNKKIPGMLDSLIQRSQANLMQSIQEYNNVVQQSVHQNAQLGRQQQMIEQIKVIEFNTNMQIKVSIKSIYVYIQKIENSNELQRKWMKNEDFLNIGLQNSYFLLAIQKFIYHSKEQDHTLKLQLSKLELLHVKFRQYKKNIIQNKNELNESNQFSDLRDSNCFYDNKEESFNQIKLKNHYCVQQILRISNNSSQNSLKQNVTKYSFLAPVKQEKQNVMIKLAFQLNSEIVPISRLPVTKMQFMNIALSMNTQIIKQILDLYLLVSQQLQIAKGPNANSQNQKNQAKQETKTRKLLTIKINLLNISYLDSSLSQYKSSVQKYMNGEKQKFDSCFCNMNTNGLYFQVNQIHYEQSLTETIINFRKLEFGIMKMADSLITQTSSIISINPMYNQHKQQIKFQMLLCENINQKLSLTYIILPEVIILIQQKQTLLTLQLIKIQLQNTKQALSQISKNNKNQQTQIQILQPRIEVYVQQLNIKIIQAQLYIKHLYISSQNSMFVVKLQTLVLGISDKLQLFSSQMLDQKPILTKYSQHKHKHSFIKDGNIVLQIQDNKAKNIYNKSSLKLSQFLDKISKSTANLIFTINGGSPNQINVQYQSNQTLFLKIQAPIYICAVNILKLIDKKGQLKLFIQKVRTQKAKIVKLYGQIFVFKSQLNVSGNEQNYKEKLFTIQSGRIHVDIRPTYLQSTKVVTNDESKKIIFSNTRSFLQLSWNDLSIQMYIKEQKTYIKGIFNIRYLMKQMRLFNYHDQILINEKDLQKQEFKQLLKIQNIQLFIEMIQNHINTKIDINSIKYESNLKTLYYLILHWKQFVRHNIKKNFGLTIKQQEQQFQVLQANEMEQEEDDQQIQDLTNKSLFYIQKNQIKKNLLKKFIAKSFQPFTSDKSYAFYLQGLTIKQLKLKIIHQASQIQNIQLNMNQIQLKAKIKDLKNLQIQVLGTIKDIDLSYFCKQQENVGFFGTIYNYIYANNYKKFTLLKNNHNQIIKFALQNNSDGSFIKFDKSSLDIGFTSRILDFVQKYKAFDKLIKQEGWKKVYNQPIINQNNNNNNDNILLIFAPENNINISLIYQGVQILKQCSATAPELLLNQYSNNIVKINQYITSWIKSLLLKNVAGLVAKTLFDKFQLGVTQIVDLIIFFLSCIIGIFK